PSAPAAAAPAAGAGDAAAGLPAVHPAQGPPGRAATIVGSADHGATLFAIYCATCHGDEGRGGVPDPGSASGQVPALNPIAVTIRSSNPGDFAENLDRFLQHGAVPGQDGGALRMPAFGQTATLTQAEIADIEAYVMQQNGVDRAAILSPGIAPRRYFWLTAGASAALALLLAAGWALARGRAATR
ncbi:cytochrome c, partial [Candidatus Binatia bacterium]|nr:cytochrome c [Candidatus Binatia bacterium]